MNRANLFMTFVCIALLGFFGCSDNGNGGDDGGQDAADAADGGNGQDGADISDGGDEVEDGGGDEAEDGGGDVVQPQPGTITINASGITGHENDGYLILVAVQPAGDFQTTLGAMCFLITADPFTIPDTIVQGLEPQDPNPCSPSGGDKVFDPGDYDVYFQLIQGGQQMPEKTAKVVATVDGDITVSAPAFAEWRGPDPTKQPGTITVNATGITGHQNDGHLLLVMATMPNMQWAGLAASCHMLDADPFSLPSDSTVLQEILQGDNGPCEASGGNMEFGGGDYDVQFIVIRGGEQVPEKSVTVPAVVDGDIIVDAPDFATW
jgi:hypothetical protein